ncbi:MAG TPA: efflux RND transporter periplasmic adaptor subunit [Candidatus Acidoferrales bacterium]|nr:efflux RND transporter periplasmic adaptor subunit [Candidatus Acidoferrales bacterium]
MAMKRSRKIALVVVAALAVVAAVSIIVQRQRAGVVAVQIGTVTHQDLTAVVTASGEVRPRQYVNINAQSFGKIVEINVQEGDRVKRGQVLLRLEAIQPGADVDAQRALGKASEAAVEGAEASLRTAQAELRRSRADFERAALNWERAQGLFVDQLIAQQEYDARKADYESAKAGVELAQARVSQAQAELNRSRSTLTQARATLTRASDVLQKTIYTSPIDGVVTNLPVNVGEQMVPGIQNAPGSFLMTVADMSEVTAEVKVDETDIVNVRLGQPAEVTIDAYPNQTFKGTVTEIGTTALVRSTGRSTAELQTGTQEAKDFKVVVTLDDPPDIVRPGLSTTARVTTATREDVLAIPIQALTIRRRGDIEAAERRARGEKTAEASVAAGRPSEKDREELQGVFVLNGKEAHFREVKTGITGVTDIEVTEGLKEGEKIVTGSYKVLRELRHRAKVREEKKGEGETKE